jgi:3-oxoacyl-[acyl-carrier-protein] synthase II
MGSTERRVVVTGVGLVSPLGSTKESLWEALVQGRSGVGRQTLLPPNEMPCHAAAEAAQFRGEIDDFGPLEKEQKKSIRKGLKVMCRECQMGVAAAQLALADARIALGQPDPERTGICFGADYMLSVPEDFAEGVCQCLDGHGQFQFPRWGAEGLPKMSPLWLLKYLPNMPASHVAIYNDLRGPNNSVTVREAAANAAVGEAFHIIVRGSADTMLVGATGTRLHSMKLVHALQQEELACGDGDLTRLSRPFDRDRQGMVPGEGAAAIMLEELGVARARGATILGEVVAAASSSAAGPRLVARRDRAMANALAGVLTRAGVEPDAVGHLHAHGLSTVTCDADEAKAIQEVFGRRARPLPVVAAKSYFGNLGAGSGMVELIASLLALQHGCLFPILNYDNPDPHCPVAAVIDGSTSAGGSFINLNVTPQGQASAVMIRRLE